MSDIFIKYEKMTDEELVELSAAGDEFATGCVMNRYKNMVRSKARMYFLVGADKEDIIQEGMIGLFKAVRDFDFVATDADISVPEGSETIDPEEPEEEEIPDEPGVTPDDIL